MSIVTTVLVLAFVGFLLWLILQIPMPAVFQRIIIALVAVLAVLWLLQGFGVHIPGVPTIRLK